MDCIVPCLWKGEVFIQLLWPMGFLSFVDILRGCEGLVWVYSPQKQHTAHLHGYRKLMRLRTLHNYYTPV